LKEGTSKADDDLELLAVGSIGRGDQELLSALGQLGKHCRDMLSHSLVDISFEQHQGLLNPHKLNAYPQAKVRREPVGRKERKGKDGLVLP